MKTSALFASILILAGCGTVERNYLITNTGTIIGVQIAQNPTTQLYEAKLGYARAESALVPTNGASVLMELRYGGIFSSSGGIYQRLAVGDAAVKQPGAAFMFAKDATGNLSTNALQAITDKIQTIPLAPK